MGESGHCPDIDCCICLAPVGSSRLQQLECGHALHKSCALRWFARNRSCPMCRCHIHKKPSAILRAAFKRANVPRFSMDLPCIVKAALQAHPASSRVMDLSFMTVDSLELLTTLRALEL